MAIVASVSGATITLTSQLFDSYPVSSSTKLFKLTPARIELNDFTLKGSASTGVAVTGVQVSSGINSRIENLRIYNCSYSQLFIDRCFSTSIRNISLREDLISTFGGDYGLVIGNCQQVDVSGSDLVAARHAVTLGGGDYQANIVNRLVRISHCSIASTSTSYSADIHGNSEFCEYSSCSIANAVVFGGNNITIKDNEIGVSSPGIYASVYASELKGCSITITGNRLRNNNGVAALGCFVDIGGSGSGIDANTTLGGTVEITGNTMITSYGVAASVDACRVINNGFTTSGQECDIIFLNNIVRSFDNTNRLVSALSVTLVNGVTKLFNSVTMSSNLLIGVGGLYLKNNNPSGFAFRRVVMSNNAIQGSRFDCSSIHCVQSAVHFTGNLITDSNYCALYLYGHSNLALLVLSDNTFVNNQILNRASSSEQGELFINKVDNAVVKGTTSDSASSYLLYFGVFVTLSNLYRGHNIQLQAKADNLIAVASTPSL